MSPPTSAEPEPSAPAQPEDQLESARAKPFKDELSALGMVALLALTAVPAVAQTSTPPTAEVDLEKANEHTEQVKLERNADGTFILYGGEPEDVDQAQEAYEKREILAQANDLEARMKEEAAELKSLDNTFRDLNSEPGIVAINEAGFIEGELDTQVLNFDTASGQITSYERERTEKAQYELVRTDDGYVYTKDATAHEKLSYRPGTESLITRTHTSTSSDRSELNFSVSENLVQSAENAYEFSYRLNR